MKKAAILIAGLAILFTFSACKPVNTAVLSTSAGGESSSSGSVSSAAASSAPESADSSALSSSISSADTSGAGTLIKEINASSATIIHVPNAGYFESLADGGCVLLTGESVNGFYNTEHKATALEAIRYDKNGNMIWDKTYPELNDIVGGVGSLPDGAIFLSSYVGTEDSTSSDNNVKITGSLVKLAPDGTVLWKTALTKNYQSASAFYFATNGDIYTQGLFDSENTDASKPLAFVDAGDCSVGLTTSFCRYDKDGKELSYCAPDTGYSGGEDFSENFAKAAYLEGAGLVAAFADGVICYNSDLSQKWKYTADVQSPLGADPAYGTVLVGEPIFGKDSITFTIHGGRNDDENTTAVLSYAGKLISKTTFRGPYDYQYQSGGYIGALPDGRNIYLETTGDDQSYKTTFNFLMNGKKIQFDTLNKWQYDNASLYPTDGGGFAIAYGIGNDVATNTIIGNYDSSGKLKWQLVFSGDMSACVSGSGAAFIGSPAND